LTSPQLFRLALVTKGGGDWAWAGDRP
jgi:hypothetical protein